MPLPHLPQLSGGSRVFPCGVEMDRSVVFMQKAILQLNDAEKSGRAIFSVVLWCSRVQRTVDFGFQLLVTLHKGSDELRYLTEKAFRGFKPLKWQNMGLAESLLAG